MFSEWIHRLIRRRTKPIPRHKARLWYDRLSVLYYMSAWTAAGLTLYTLVTSDASKLPDHLNVHADEEPYTRPASRFAKFLGVQDATVIKMSNLTVKDVSEVSTVVDVKKKYLEIEGKKQEDFYGETEYEPITEKELKF